jgi:hypothetical protein
MKFLEEKIFKNAVFWFQIMGLVVLSSCNGAGGEGGDGVTIKTGGIFDKSNVSIDNNLVIGDIITGSAAKEFQITIRNDSKFDYTEVSVDFELNGDGFGFNKDEEGADNGFPGYGGTCTSVLLSKATCIVRVEYSPLRSGEFEFPFTVKFKNLVDPESFDFKITATAGLPANLIFDVGTTVNSFGPIEQTDTSVRSTNFTIKNTGGLTARNVSPSLIEDLVDPFNGYNYTNVDCPTNMRPGDSCTITVDFKPRNNGNFDPPVEYSSNLKISYNNEPGNSKLAYLNAYFSALSTKIQGVLSAPASIKDVEYIDSDGYSEITVGKTLTNTFKVSNVGYKKAQVREVHIYDTDVNADFSDDTLLARCLLDSGSGDFKCYDPDFSSGKVELSLTDDKFPWILDDLNNCLGGEIVGPPPGSTLGGSCIFDIKFHPTTKMYYEKELVSSAMVYNKTVDSTAMKVKTEFNKIRLEFLYDSYWKTFVCDDESLYFDPSRSLSCVNDEDMFKVTAVAQSAGLLEIENNELVYGLEKLTPDDTGRIDSSEVEDNFYLYDIGRRALVLDADYFTKINFSLKNKGSSTLRVSKVYMYDESDNEISLIANNAHNNLGSYFKNVLTTCNKDSVLALGDKCSFTADFVPLYISGPSFDYTTYFYDSGKDYRSVFFEFDDGTCITDNGTGTGYTDEPDHDYCAEEINGEKRGKRKIEFRIKGTLIQKGMLAFSKDPTSYNFADDGVVMGKNPNSIISGDNTNYHTVKITNVGTGPIPYIKFRQFNDASPGDEETYLFKRDDARYPYELVNLPAGPGKDCLTIFDKKNFSVETVDGSSNPTSFLFDTFDFMKNNGPIPSRLQASDVSLISDIKNNVNGTHLVSGESCSLRIHFTQKEEARSVPIDLDAPGEKLFRLEAEKASALTASKTYDLKRYGGWANNWAPKHLSFEYFNGDSSADPSEQTVVGLGTLETITGPEGLDHFKVDINYASKGEVVPTNVLPFQSASMYRPEFIQTEVTYDSSFYSPQPADASSLVPSDNIAFGIDEIDELFFHYGSTSLAPSNVDANLIYKFPNIKNKSKSLKLSNQDGDGTPHFEYFVHFGTFENGTTHSGLNLGFTVFGGPQNVTVEYDTDGGTLDNPACGLSEATPLNGTLVEFTYNPTFAAGDSVTCVRVLKVSYETMVIKADLSKEVETYKVMLVAESRRNALTPNIGFKYKSYNADGSELASPTWVPFSTGMNNDPTSATNISMSSIVETEETPGTKGLFYGKKSIQLTNSAASSNATNIRLYFKTLVAEDEYLSLLTTSSLLVNNGLKIEDGANCTGLTSLAATESCTFDVTYNPGASSSASTALYLVMAYDLFSGTENGLPVTQRVEKIVKFSLSADFPAFAKADASADYEIQVAGNGVDEILKVDYGTIQLGGVSSVMLSSAKTVNLTNTKSLGASMCRQWQIFQYDSLTVTSDVNGYLQNLKTFNDGVTELVNFGDYSIDEKSGLLYTKDIIGGGHTVTINITYKDKPDRSVTFSEGFNNHNLAYDSTLCLPNIVSDYATILDTAKLKIDAHKDCFYGSNSANETDVTLGFPGGFGCSLKTYYKANFRDIFYNDRNQKYGYEITPTMADQCENIQYYSYNREIKSSKNIEICSRAYILPEVSSTVKTSSNFRNIESENIGGALKIKLEFEEAKYDAGTVWGPIEKYALYIKPKANALNKIYRNEFNSVSLSNVEDSGGISYFQVVDLVSAGPGYYSAEITSLPNGDPLIPGIYYDVQAFSLRENNGVYYLSDMGYDVASILVPPPGTFYDYANKRLVDTEPILDISGTVYETFTRDAAIDKCTKVNYSLQRKGLPVVVNKKLFSSSEIALIKDNMVLANDYNYWEHGHWLSDNKVNIETIWNSNTVDPFNSSTFSFSGCIGPFDGICGQRSYLPADPTPEEPSLMYNRACGDDPDCNNLYSVYGAIELFNQDFYTFDDTLELKARCWATVP